MNIVIWCDKCLSTVTVSSKQEVLSVLAQGWTLKLNGEKNYYGQCAECNEKRSGFVSRHEILQDMLQ